MEITAAIAAFFTWAATPPGQQITMDMIKANHELVGKIADLFNHLHKAVVKTDGTNESNSIKVA